jgi:hypothetical protein
MPLVIGGIAEIQWALAMVPRERHANSDFVAANPNPSEH